MAFKVNESLVLMIGGYHSEEGVTYLIDPSSEFKMSRGPNLQQARYIHSCGLIEVNGMKKVVVAGGLHIEGLNTGIGSTEIWDLDANSGWKWGKGPFIKDVINQGGEVFSKI